MFLAESEKKMAKGDGWYASYPHGKTAHRLIMENSYSQYQRNLGYAFMLCGHKIAPERLIRLEDGDEVKQCKQCLRISEKGKTADERLIENLEMSIQKYKDDGGNMI